MRACLAAPHSMCEENNAPRHGAATAQVILEFAAAHLQAAGQLPAPDPDVIVSVHSSDEVHDFFDANGLGACEDAVCKFLGIESASDLKLVTAEDIVGSQFAMWARGSLTIVQQKKLLKAFS